VSRPESVRLAARAKLNLSLDVLRKRPDGFHEIRTVMQTLDWFDEIEMRRSSKTQVSVGWGPGLSGKLPDPPDLVERAIGIVNQTLGGTQAAEVTLVKNIPIGAGLGGGSADAAAAILGVNALAGEAMSRLQMTEIAAQLGSDVPFALDGGTSLVEGRGERLSRLEHRALWWVIGVPDFSLDTGEVYSRWDEIGSPSSVDKAALPESEDPGDVATFLRNDLEAAAFDIEPSIRALKEEMRGAGALGAVMCGSGPSIAGLCRDASDCDNVASKLSSFLIAKAVPSSAIGVEILA
jgi:4-diphosphocytidyl-2-C-methyl-D-erythritol kinase